jgi:hypothetical protein
MRARTAAPASVYRACGRLVAGASAQAPGAPRSEPSDDQVARILSLALDNITRGLCENAQPCSPATAAERADPPVTIAEARAIMRRGVLTSAAKECGMDWQRRNFTPMTRYWRHDMKKNERQMTLIVMLHGIMQGMTEASLRGRCTEQMRQSLEAQLDFKP